MINSRSAWFHCICVQTIAGTAPDLLQYVKSRQKSLRTFSKSSAVGQASYGEDHNNVSCSFHDHRKVESNLQALECFMDNNILNSGRGYESSCRAQEVVL